MDRMELKKRWIMGTVHPELFYLPWGHRTYQYYNLEIYHYVYTHKTLETENGELIKEAHLMNYVLTTYKLLSDKDISSIRTYKNTLSGIEIIDDNEIQITVTNNNYRDYINHSYQQILSNMRIANYTYQEIEPPICYEYEGEYINCYPLSDDIHFTINKDTLNSSLNSFRLNIYHDYPTIKLVATWIPIPDWVCTSYRRWELFTDPDSQEVFTSDVYFQDYGKEMLGVKIYVDEVYQGFFSNVTCTHSGSDSFYYELNESAPTIDVNMYSCPKKDQIPEERVYFVPTILTKTLYLVHAFCYLNKRPTLYGGEFSEYASETYNTNLERYYLGNYGRYYQMGDYHDHVSTVVSKAQIPSEIGQYDKESYMSFERRFSTKYIDDININNPTVDDVGSYTYLGDGLTKEKLNMFLNMELNSASPFQYRFKYEIVNQTGGK